MLLKKRYLWFPICPGDDERYLTLRVGTTKIHEFKIPYKEGAEAEFFASIPVYEHIGKEIIFEGDFPQSYVDSIRNEDEVYWVEENRPEVHFTANCGWINDPNGLVFDGKKYHLYFQHNPFNTHWQNMLWGSAVSEDLIHWEQYDEVLFPDEYGMMFSGSGIKNDRELLGLDDDALIFFYTAAGATAWSEDKLPVQKMAVSTDGGRTLVKRPEICVPVITKDTRDPKVFWHEASGAYVMVIYIGANDFGIFRSTDLLEWQQTQLFTLADAWECPDLIDFDTDNGKVWMFTSADGFYYFGTFDGYRFETDGVKHVAYGNNCYYAAQSYSGVEGRKLLIPWIRIDGNGKKYNGCMGVPRELELRDDNGCYILRLPMAREYQSHLVKTTDVPKSGPYMLQLDCTDDWSLQIGQSRICFSNANRNIEIDDSRYEVLLQSQKVALFIDYNILEISQANDVLIAAYLLQGDTNNVSMTNCESVIYKWED